MFHIPRLEHRAVYTLKSLHKDLFFKHIVHVFGYQLSKRKTQALCLLGEFMQSELGSYQENDTLFTTNNNFQFRL